MRLRCGGSTVAVTAGNIAEITEWLKVNLREAEEEVFSCKIAGGQGEDAILDIS